MRSLSDTAKLFGRMAAFGIVVGSGYWFLTYEQAGTILLIAFGGASLIAAIAVFAGSRRRRSETAGDAAAGGPEAGGAAGEPLPGPGWAPLGIGAGLGAVAVGAAFGPWLMIAGVLIAIVGGLTWLGAAMREAEDAEADPTPRRHA